MGVIKAVRKVLVRAPREEVWKLVSDTDRMNRRIGLGEISIQKKEATADSPSRFVMTTNSMGIPLTYEESPFEWRQGSHFRVFRKMRGGIVASTTSTFEFATVGDGTEVTCTVEAEPRSILFSPIAWFAVNDGLKRVVELLHSIEKFAVEKKPHPYAIPASTPDEEALTRAKRELEQVTGKTKGAELLAKYLREASDADCFRMRPFELAEEWNIDRREVLHTFLHGVPAGLVELQWSLICPSCRLESSHAKSLEAIGTEGHCQLCDLTFELEFDRAVEATFKPHPGVRKVGEQLFCMAGPGRMPHILSQAILPLGGKSTMQAPSEEGRYRLFVRSGGISSIEVSSAGAARASLVAKKGELDQSALRLAPNAPITIENEVGEATHAKIEKLEYQSLAVSAHVLSTLPDFRRLFSKDIIKQGTILKVARVALLFSDLVGSTALYATVGDAAAFRLVDDHFDVLRSAIAASSGTVVKTMGDAVMAAFDNEDDCVRAAKLALEGFERFKPSSEHGHLVGLKLGMYAGPCYVVSANGVLDYFGQTVNVAARIQALAGGAELVVPASTFEAMSVSERRAFHVIEAFETRVKGVADPLSLVRLGLASAHGMERSQAGVGTAIRT